MGVPGIIVARTDAEAANLLEGCGDERDQPFILGATNTDVPAYKAAFLAVIRRLLHRRPDRAERPPALRALRGRVGRGRRVARASQASPPLLTMPPRRSWPVTASRPRTFSTALPTRSWPRWQADAGRPHAGRSRRRGHGVPYRGRRAARHDRRRVARRSPATASWYTRACQGRGAWAWTSPWSRSSLRRRRATTRCRAAFHYAIAKSLAVAPFADLLWMETKTADLHDAKEFADAIHAVFPNQMLAYNLSPSFNWDTTGMNDDEMREFPEGTRQAWASCSTSSRTAATRSTVSRPRSSARRFARTACWPSPACSASSACSSRPTARRRPWSVDRAPTPASVGVRSDGHDQGDG